jgi:uncharacterized protein YqjF (DUF2071 family)
MAKPFLSANWRNLVMASYSIDPSLLQNYLPCKTELDTYNGDHYISLVAFFFEKVKLHGISFPYHTNFEEVNLRFYVRYKENNIWKRGVVFIKEIVPRRAVSFIANKLYGENYSTYPMRRHWIQTQNQLIISYSWKIDSKWNYMGCIAEERPKPIVADSLEAFFADSYRVYTSINQQRTDVYEVAHPKWKIHRVRSHEIVCSAKQLYGEAFEETLNQLPTSVFLAEGSRVEVTRGSKINAASES